MEDGRNVRSWLCRANSLFSLVYLRHPGFRRSREASGQLNTATLPFALPVWPAPGSFHVSYTFIVSWLLATQPINEDQYGNWFGSVAPWS